jgi:hypothetical protein
VNAITTKLSSRSVPETVARLVDIVNTKSAKLFAVDALTTALVAAE